MHTNSVTATHLLHELRADSQHHSPGKTSKLALQSTAKEGKNEAKDGSRHCSIGFLRAEKFQKR